jgi:hypothetical protein
MVSGLSFNLGSAAKDCSMFLAAGLLAQAVKEVSKTAKLTNKTGRLQCTTLITIQVSIPTLAKDFEKNLEIRLKLQRKMSKNCKTE